MAKSKIPNALVTTNSQQVGGYKSFNATSKKTIVASQDNVVKEYDAIYGAGTVTDPVDNINVRTPFTKSDYTSFRPDEKVPSKYVDQVKVCRQVYKMVGVVRNVIDLMTDFACEDLRIVHKDPAINAFYKAWAKKTNLNEVSNEYVKHLLIDANVIVKRIIGRISRPYERQMIKDQKAKGEADEEVRIKKYPFATREIPIRYTFLNVSSLEWEGGEATRILNNRQLLFNVSKDIIKMISNPTTVLQKEIISKLPVDIRKQLQNKTNNGGKVKLDMDKVHVSHAKKDSWEDWATPFMVSVLPDIFFKEKLRQADVAALDGVINVIRIWKLGDHKEGILPDTGAITRLAEILQANVGGGAIDVIWDTMLEMKEYYPPVDKILGSEKYTQVNSDILIGLGVPDVLLGGDGANFSNSFIQLKTIVERLEYVRANLRQWIMSEIAIVAKTMGHSELPIISFGNMDLQDENVSKQLVIQLLDRNVISIEAVLRTFGEDFAIEYHRIKNETKMIEKDKLEMPKSPIQEKEEPQGQDNGRPPNKKDVQRKQRKAKPKTAELLCNISGVVDIFDKDIVDTYLKEHGIKNARRLTNGQKDAIDQERRRIISSVNSEDLQDISLNVDVINTMVAQEGSCDEDLIAAMNQNFIDFVCKNKIQPTLEQKKRIEIATWVEYYSNEGEESDA